MQQFSWSHLFKLKVETFDEKGKIKIKKDEEEDGISWKDKQP
jgi:hypothetical protein